MVNFPGKVSTIVLLSYRFNGESFPFSSEIRTPLEEGFGPRPVQNFASIS